MLLEGRNAVVHGGGGAIGGAAARAIESMRRQFSSGRARTMTAATVNISCGALVG